MRQQTKICVDLRQDEVDPNQISAWVSAGADALMFTYGGSRNGDWERICDAVRRTEDLESRPVALILDLPEYELAEPLINDGVLNQVHMIAVSAERGGAGIRSLRESLNGARDLDIVAKLDTPNSFSDVEAIIQSADAVIVTLEGLRSLQPSEAPVAQKQVSRHCQAAAIPCFVERDSFSRLSNSPNQHQADIFDLSNIVFDHADGILLKADDFECSDVRPPMETVRSILVASEAYLEVTDRPVRVGFGQPPNTAALAYAIRHILKMQEIAAVAVYSITGTTARVISKNWLDTPILAFSPRLPTARRMSLYHGVTSRHFAEPLDAGELLKKAGDLALQLEIALPGDRIIVVSGHPNQTQDQANGFVVETVG